MSKYGNLKLFLASQSAGELRMSFDEVEKAAAIKLPSSAYEYPAWWSNHVASHVQARAWLDAGYETQQVDMAGKTLVFKRIPQSTSSQPGMAEPQRGFSHEEAPPKAQRHPLLGAMKGWFVIEPGYDLTQPTMPEWAELIEKKYGPEKLK